MYQKSYYHYTIHSLQNSCYLPMFYKYQFSKPIVEMTVTNSMSILGVFSIYQTQFICYSMCFFIIEEKLCISLNCNQPPIYSVPRSHRGIITKTNRRMRWSIIFCKYTCVHSLIVRSTSIKTTRLTSSS